MAPRRRPTAFEVSFPGETEDEIPSESGLSKYHHSLHLQSRSPSVASTSSLGKRKGDALDTRVDAYYKKRKNTIVENEDLIISGEDPEDEDEDKPIRELLDFSIFDPRRRNELVTLEALEQDDGIDRAFEAAGMVKPHYVSEEDEGQEEEPDEPQYVHLSAILRYTVDYTQESEQVLPFYIETQYAWYILKNPSASYKVFYEHFYSPRRVAQIVIARALNRPNEDFKSFLDRFTKQVDMFGRTYVEQHIWDYLLDINDIIRESDDAKKVMVVPFVKTILRRAPQMTETQRSPRLTRPMIKRQPKNKALLGSIDIAVLKNENQNTTCVTPRIARLAKGLFREEMIVLGPPPPLVNKAEVEAAKAKAFATLRHLIAKAKVEKKKITYRKEDRITVRHDPVLYNAINIERVDYKIGDIVLFPNPEVMADVEAKKIRPDANSRIDDFFWFAKIIYIMAEIQKVHVQWFNHGSLTILKEFAHPQELYLADLCGHESLTNIVGKVTVHFAPNAVVPKDKPEEYFCKFTHDTKTGVFSDLDIKRIELCDGQKSPDNCPVCPIQEENDLKKEARALKDEFGNLDGVAFAGISYHLEDFVLYRANEGPANIGYITHVAFPKKNIAKVTMRKVGRISDLGHVLPAGTKRDERQLFLTDETVTVDVSKDKALLQVIYVPCIESFEAPHATLEDWLELSYDNFYLLYIFPRLKVQSWDEKKKMRWQKHQVCTPCCKEFLEKRKHMYKFLNQSREKPLATLDLFGGVGGFSRGLAEGSGCLKVTHAVEIGPSAAKTFARNSPDTVIYNQCANEILRYAVKSQQRHQIEVPKQKYDDKTPVAPPPKPGDIKVITAGFPCQSHSTMNMYKTTDDLKSNLILTTLAYLDYYSPDFAYFENVPGFLRFSLKATQENEHRVSGDIDMGGVKLLLRALVDMNYQFQFGLLQAAHYGTPQRRVRFFLVAAKQGQVLPSLPQPTHDFPDSKILSIKFDDKQDAIAPIRMAHGTARNPCVTIEDAIGDLPRFDWKHPKPSSEGLNVREKRRKRAQKVPAVECDIKETFSGFRGKIGYYTSPQTRYQQRARLLETADIQHYTKCLLPKKVERVLNVPLKAGADYKSLPAFLHEWQFVDPTSSVGKLNYRPGIYGRLDKDGVFPTTVTNVDPTAKQSQVLHPWCFRMVTVRELARSQGFPDSFVFETLGKLNVVTIHRQIGNAVPLPLAHALGRELRESLYNLWNTKRENAIVIEDNDLAQGVAQQHLVNETEDDSDMYTD
ncbi:hypothetical protein CVT25_009784 [Psilocybe cyanescens]|uniref:DNA (cytosine-5-)-methyltransferase n=1 Tax=Psilocybe cyanescens TaxID=93625 RepID=A0A409X871_PSICY|nr:hypothetical protein CVT25_009784 [Psilocybe cyanescens]